MALISQGKEATVYSWGGQLYKQLMSNFLGIWHTEKSLKSVNFWESYLKKGGRFPDTVHVNDHYKSAFVSV